MKRYLTLAILILLVGMMSACGAAEEAVDPVTESCDALTQLNEAINATKLITPDMDVLDITQVQTQLINSWSTLVSSVDRLDPAQQPASIAAADGAFDAIPVATDETQADVARQSVDAQVNVAQGVVDEFTPFCASQPSN